MRRGGDKDRIWSGALVPVGSCNPVRSLLVSGSDRPERRGRRKPRGGARLPQEPPGGQGPDQDRAPGSHRPPPDLPLPLHQQALLLPRLRLHRRVAPHDPVPTARAQGHLHAGRRPRARRRRRGPRAGPHGASGRPPGRRQRPYLRLHSGGAGGPPNLTSPARGRPRCIGSGGSVSPSRRTWCSRSTTRCSGPTSPRASRTATWAPPPGTPPPWPPSSSACPTNTRSSTHNEWVRVQRG
ncbi:hypothetical protein SEVIR_9G097301v4 [Setaria viridis]